MANGDFRFFRGNEADLPVLPPGKPAFTLDSHKLFVGSSTGNVDIGTINVNNYTLITDENLQDLMDALPTITVGTTTTLSAGASATVTNTGSATQAVFNFGIPKGADGTDGTNGVDGNDGADGTSFVWKGAYAAGTAYAVNDTVSYNGSSYVCIASSTGNLPTNGTYWNVMAQKGSDGAGSGDMLASAYDTNGDGIVNQAETVTDKAITFAKMADLATARILGRTTAGSGSPEALTGAQALAIVGAEAALGNPDTDGKVLSSTAAGARSWITPSGGSGGGYTGIPLCMTNPNDNGESNKVKFKASKTVSTCDVLCPVCQSTNIWVVKVTAAGVYSKIGDFNVTGNATPSITSTSFASGDWVYAKVNGAANNLTEITVELS